MTPDEFEAAADRCPATAAELRAAVEGPAVRLSLGQAVALANHGVLPR